MRLRWSSCLLPCLDDPCALTPRESIVEEVQTVDAAKDKRAVTADGTRVPVRVLTRSMTESRVVESRGLKHSIVCIGADASSLLSVVHPLSGDGSRLAVVDVVSEWITKLVRFDLGFQLKLDDDSLTADETQTWHTVDACGNFYGDVASQWIIECDLIASALASEELALFIPHLLTLLRRRRALNPKKPLRILQIERVCLPVSVSVDLSESLLRAAEEKWPTDAMRWLKDKVSFLQALSVELLLQNIRSYERGQIVALQPAQLFMEAGQPTIPGCHVTDDLTALRHLAQLAQSLSFLVGVAKNTINIKFTQVQRALNEAFDAFATAFTWADKASVASNLAQMLCSTTWTLQQQHTMKPLTIAACIEPSLRAYQMAQENNWPRLSLQWLLHTSLKPINQNGQMEQIFRQITAGDNTFSEIASLIH